MTIDCDKCDFYMVHVFDEPCKSCTKHSNHTIDGVKSNNGGDD